MNKSLSMQAEFRSHDDQNSRAACTLGQLAEVLLDLGLSIDESNGVMLDLLSSGELRLSNVDRPGDEPLPHIH